MSEAQFKLILYCAAAFLGANVTAWLVYGLIWWLKNSIGW